MSDTVDEAHLRKLEHMASEAAICKLTSAGFRFAPGKAEVSFEAKPEFFHAAGALHGAMYFYGLDTAAFFAANTLLPEVFVLTVSFQVYLTRPISGGRVTAYGEVVQPGRSQILAEARLVDADGHECARGSGMFVPGRTRLTPEIGYC